MTVKKLTEILDKHKKWLRCEGDGSRADLYGANLSREDLSGANLSRADLSRADLSGANLSGADLSGADLYGANLSRADLSVADLYGANLSRADLSGANLSGANLSRADLYGANLSGATIEFKLLNKFCPITCPESGSFIGWKRCRGNKIVKLMICEDAKRSSAYGRKCRCSAAKVIAIENLDGTPHKESEAYSGYNKNFVYRVGETVSVDNFDNDRRNECAPGIHFFITRQEAVDYVL